MRVTRVTRFTGARAPLRGRFSPLGEIALKGKAGCLPVYGV